MQHLPRGEVEGVFDAWLLFFLRRVAEHRTARKAHRQGERAKRPERAPDPLHRAKAPQRRPDKQGQERAGKSHRTADDPGRQPLAPRVPLLGAGLDRGVQKGCAQPRRDAEGQKEPPPCPARQKGRCKKAAAEQGCAPQRRAARPLFVLQKTAQHTPHPKGGNKQGKGVTRPLLRKAVFLHDRLLKNAPSRR